MSGLSIQADCVVLTRGLAGIQPRTNTNNHEKRHEIRLLHLLPSWAGCPCHLDVAQPPLAVRTCPGSSSSPIHRAYREESRHVRPLDTGRLRRPYSRPRWNSTTNKHE